MSITDFQRSYEISPIILNGGIAAKVPGGMIPIISLTQPNNFSNGLLGQADSKVANGSGLDKSVGKSGLSFDDYVAHFSVLPGGTLIDNEIGEYPFANQQVAANAIIVQPLRVSLLMTAPAPTNGGYPAKLSSFTSLRETLYQHIIQGGTFTVATPSFLYTNALLVGLRDVSSNNTSQVQTQWQWDFKQPLLTQAAAQAAQNSLMSKISNGTQTTGDPPAYSGTAAAVGSPSSGVAPPLIPAAKSTAASSTLSGNSIGLIQGPQKVAGFR